MKKILILVFAAFLLVGCQKETDDHKEKDNIVEDIKDESMNIVNGLEDMINDFTNNGIQIDSHKKIEHTGLNAYEAYEINTNGNKAYLYRLNESDEQMKQLIEHQMVVAKLLN